MIKSDKLLHKSKNYQLVKSTVKLPNGLVRDFDVIRHDGAVVIIPLISNDRVIMIWQYRPAIKKYIFELPAGTIDKKEKSLNCAKREIIEETGYKANRMKFIGDVVPVPGYSSEILKYYVARGLKFVGQDTEDSEVIEVKMFSKKDIVKMFKTGKIIDAKTIAGFAMIGWI